MVTDGNPVARDIVCDAVMLGTPALALNEDWSKLRQLGQWPFYQWLLRTRLLPHVLSVPSGWSTHGWMQPFAGTRRGECANGLIHHYSQ